MRLPFPLKRLRRRNRTQGGIGLDSIVIDLLSVLYERKVEFLKGLATTLFPPCLVNYPSLPDICYLQVEIGIASRGFWPEEDGDESYCGCHPVHKFSVHGEAKPGVCFR